MKCSIIISIFLLATGYFSAGQQAPAQQTYPRIVTYASFIHPIVTFDKDQTTFNFDKSYTVGFPIGINILKSDKMGFSFEITPFIRSQHDTSKVTHILFHPGAMFRFKHGFTFIARLAFETGGRYGVTPVFNQVFLRTKFFNYFVAASAPLRMGNGRPLTLGLAVQLGVTF